jgi:DNA-binding response OmpR family regulator
MGTEMTAPTWHAPIRLLVVEDSSPFLHLIQRAFREHRSEVRWELTGAVDGQQALNNLSFEEENENVPLPDPILLDWNLSEWR